MSVTARARTWGLSSLLNCMSHGFASIPDMLGNASANCCRIFGSGSVGALCQIDQFAADAASLQFHAGCQDDLRIGMVQSAHYVARLQLLPGGRVVGPRRIERSALRLKCRRDRCRPRPADGKRPGRLAPPGRLFPSLS